METRIRTADERRKEIEEAAARMGIDETYVSILVDTFYERIRDHAELGPIFEEKVAGAWPLHLARMKDFWSSVALNTGRYSGRPVPKHVALSSLKPEHFEMWLALFRQTLDDTAPTPEAADYFFVRAQRIGESIKLAVFGLPGLVSPAREDAS
jgi:hemoglobin